MSSVFDNAEKAGGRQLQGVSSWQLFNKGEKVVSQLGESPGKDDDSSRRRDTGLQVVAIVVGVLTLLGTIFSLAKPFQVLTETEWGKLVGGIGGAVLGIYLGYFFVKRKAK